MSQNSAAALARAGAHTPRDLLPTTAAAGGAGFLLVGVALSRSRDTARSFLVGGGAIYLVLWLYGLVVGQNSSANFVPVNTADDWLHFVLGAGMIGLGLALSRRPADVRR